MKKYEETFKYGESICDLLRISRQTLYRWCKIVPLPRGFKSRWGKPFYARMIKAQLKAWAEEVISKNPGWMNSEKIGRIRDM